MEEISSNPPRRQVIISAPSPSSQESRTNEGSSSISTPQSSCVVETNINDDISPTQDALRILNYHHTQTTRSLVQIQGTRIAEDQLRLQVTELEAQLAQASSKIASARNEARKARQELRFEQEFNLAAWKERAEAQNVLEQARIVHKDEVDRLHRNVRR